MPDINENPISSKPPSNYTFKKAEEVQAEHKKHLNSLFTQLRQTKSQAWQVVNKTNFKPLDAILLLVMIVRGVRKRYRKS